MISAADPAFWQQYPNGCTVYDRLGRRLRKVASFNPETGEVAMGRGRFCRHGFWPAPLRVVPRLVIHIGFEADK